MASVKEPVTTFSKPAPPLSAARSFLSALGGAQTRILARAQVDVPEMAGRGIAALIPAVFGAMAAIVMLRDAYEIPVAAAVPFGCGWGTIVLFFDQSLMSAAPSRSALSRAVIIGSRALVSVLAALTFAGALVLALYNTDILTRMRADQQAALASYNNAYIVGHYQPVISADEHQLAGDQAKIGQASRAVATSIPVVAGIVAAPVVIAGAAIGALAGLDPVVFGVVPAGAPRTGRPAAWYVLASWVWDSPSG